MSAGPQHKMDTTVTLPPIKQWTHAVFAQAVANAINASVSSNLVEVARVHKNGLVISKDLFRRFIAAKKPKRGGDEPMNATLKSKNRKIHT